MPRSTFEKCGQKEGAMLQILGPDGRIADLPAARDLRLTAADYHKIKECMRFTRAFEEVAAKKAQMENHYPLYISPKGQEAAEAASAFLLGEDDWIFWYTRSQAAAFMRGVSIDAMWRLFYGVPEPNAVEDMLLHRAMPPYVLVAINLTHAVGYALAKKIRGEPGVTVAYFGDGATSRADFHSAMNFAAIHKVPTIFICENNQWAISTPPELQTATKTFAEKGLGYAVPSEPVDGNDIFAVLFAMRWALERARNGDGPTLIEMVTYRLDPHTTAVGEIVRVPEEVMAAAKDRDPIVRLERFEASGGARALFKNPPPRETAWEPLIRSSAKKVEAALAGHNGKDVCLRLERLMENPVVDPAYLAPKTFGENYPDARMLDAINIAQYDLMGHDNRVMAFGEDVGRSGGAYRAVALPKSFVAKYLPERENELLQRYLPLQNVFGANRAIDTPVDEWGIMGHAIGLALGGMRPIVEAQFSGFVYGMGDHLFSELPDMRQRSAGKLAMPIVLRLPCGAGFFIRNHREFEAPSFMNTPGLVIAYPSTPQDAYDLLLAAVASDKPVLFFENKDLYRGKLHLAYTDPRDRKKKIEKTVSVTSLLSRALPTTPIEEMGVRIAREGGDITFLSYGKTLYHCLEAAELLAEEGIEAEVLDVRVFKPFDRASLIQSVKKTGALVAVGEEPVFGGTMAEFVSEVAESEEAFYFLSAPVVRLGPGNYHHPPHAFTNSYVPQPDAIYDAAKRTVEKKR